MTTPEGLLHAKEEIIKNLQSSVERLRADNTRLQEKLAAATEGMQRLMCVDHAIQIRIQTNDVEDRILKFNVLKVSTVYWMSML